MPYKIHKKDDKWCVYNKDTGESKGCSDSEKEAKAHMRALYANEAKEQNKELTDAQLDELVEKSLGTKGYVPDWVTSFDMLEQYRQDREQAEKMFERADDFLWLAQNILSDPFIEDKSSALEGLSREFGQQVTKEQPSAPIVDKIVDRVRQALGIKDNKQKQAPMLIWKEADTGRYKWLARYSNNIRDDDGVPEIISEKSHRRYVELVDKGIYPLPELWIWHRPEWKIGYATEVAYDDTGFAIATGYFDKGKEEYAEWLSKQKDVAVSHGYPPTSVRRDTQDNTVITEHQTVEISPLPHFAAANKLTGFMVVSDEDSSKNRKDDDAMPIPEEKRKSLIEHWGISPDTLARLEASNQADKARAEEQGRDSKEADEAQVEQQQTPQMEQPTTDQPATMEQEYETQPETDTQPETQPETEIETESQIKEETPQTETADQDTAMVSKEEVAEVLATMISTFDERLTAMQTAIDEMTKEVSELKASDEEKIAKQAKEAPAASLSAMIANSIIGKSEAREDGRSVLAKSRPKETPSNAGTFGIGLIDRIVAGGKPLEYE